MHAPFNDGFLGRVIHRVMTSRATGCEYAVHIGLPPGYAEDDLLYPLLIVLDGNYYFGSALEAASLGAMSGDGAPIIVVGVGTAAGLTAHAMRRLKDYLPEPFPAGSGTPVMQAVRGMVSAMGLDPDTHIGHADLFLAYIQDELILTLLTDYRIDPADMGLAGHSAGGVFSCYAMLRQAVPLSKFIIGSFGAPWLGSRTLDLAEAFVRETAGVMVFYAVGGAEISASVGGLDLKQGRDLLENLAERNGAIKLTATVFQGESHASVTSHLLSSGVRTLWPGHGPAAARRY